VSPARPVHGVFVVRDVPEETLVDLRVQRCPACGTPPAPSEAELIEVSTLVALAASDCVKIRSKHADDSDIAWWYNGGAQRAFDTVRRLIELARQRGGR
jgi:hypothetical protein